MLFKFLKQLSTKRIVLASGSPRRKEILESINLNIEVHPSKFEENLNPKDFPSFQDYVMQTAHGKAADVAGILKDAELVVAADTMVVCDGELMGKPKEPVRAREMLRNLSGKTHQVYTGVVLIWPQTNVTRKFCEVTNVTFGVLDDEVIDLYIATNEPFDKAGGYGIQGLGGSLIESIQGDYYTVMGLPLHRFCFHVKEYYDDRLLNQS